MYQQDTEDTLVRINTLLSILISSEILKRGEILKVATVYVITATEYLYTFKYTTDSY